ncbi:MAG: DNA recombination protein RmuC [Frankiaceae bacterium]
MTAVNLILGLVLLSVGWLLGVLVASARAQTRARSSDIRVRELETALDYERRLRRDEGELARQFDLLSARALERVVDSTANLADGERHRHAREVEALVGPVREALSAVQTQLTEVERQRVAAYAGLLSEVAQMRTTGDQLRAETSVLVSALRAPNVRGRWGEMQLRRVVEAAGMVQHCHFTEQDTLRTTDGTLRPDLLVHLTGGRVIAVDSKTPLGPFLEAVHARDDAGRKERRKAHARQLRHHVDQLSGKAYWAQFDSSPDFVVMFVPADPILDAALEEDPALLEYAFARNIVPTTPSTLVALLRTVAHTWRQETLAGNAREIVRLGRDLHERLGSLASHVERLGRSLTGCVRSYNEAVGSLESRVLVTARRFTELGAATDPPVTVQKISAAVRAVGAPELARMGGEVVRLSLLDEDDSPAPRRADQ